MNFFHPRVDFNTFKRGLPAMEGELMIMTSFGILLLPCHRQPIRERAGCRRESRRIWHTRAWFCQTYRDIGWRHPGLDRRNTQRFLNVGTSSVMVAQHSASTGSTFCVSGTYLRPINVTFVISKQSNWY